jgi:hypothetical protein
MTALILCCLAFCLLKAIKAARKSKGSFKRPAGWS